MVNALWRRKQQELRDLIVDGSISGIETYASDQPCFLCSHRIPCVATLVSREYDSKTTQYYLHPGCYSDSKSIVFVKGKPTFGLN